MRVGAIDCGTNSIRLLIADGTSAGLVDIVRRMEIVRLGEGIDRTGEFAPDALRRTLTACEDYGRQLAEHGVDRVRFIATSASRDARNRQEFVDGVRQRIGVEPEVVTGTEEAYLSFTGAVRGLPSPPPPPVLVVDIGGGSTEFVRGSTAVDQAVSVNIGCVRMTERHLQADPPERAAVERVTADIDAHIATAAESVPITGAAALVGLAGSVTTVAAIALGLTEYDPRALHGARISAEEVAAVTAELLGMTREQRAALPVMHPGRVDVIGAGALILHRIMVRTSAPEVIVSETDILDGIAWSLFEPNRAGPNRAGPNRAGPGRAGPGRAGPGRGSGD